MTSLIILLWACGWVVGLAATAYWDRYIMLSGVLILFVLSPLFSIGAICIYVAEKLKDKIIWKASK